MRSLARQAALSAGFIMVLGGAAAGLAPTAWAYPSPCSGERVAFWNHVNDMDVNGCFDAARSEYSGTALNVRWNNPASKPDQVATGKYHVKIYGPSGKVEYHAGPQALIQLPYNYDIAKFTVSK